LELIMKKFRIHYVGLSALLVLLPGLAASQTTEPTKTPAKHTAAKPAVQRLGGTKTWNAYIYHEKAGRVCYVAGGTQKAEPAKFKRKPPAAMVTHRPEEKVANVVSFFLGYLPKAGSDAGLDIDGKSFDLFTKGDTAWSRTSDLDKEIVEAMVKGRQAVIKSTPQKGPPAIDTYSLAGFAPTVALIDKACGVSR
jgi:hypothetical protein